MKKEFVTYEIALKLKELGFDEVCFGAFVPDEDNCLEIGGIFKECKSLIKSPLWQQVVDWFRDEYKLIIEIYYNFGSKKFEWQIDDFESEKDIDDETCTQFVNYHDAREQAILKALEIIKQV